MFEDNEDCFEDEITSGIVVWYHGNYTDITDISWGIPRKGTELLWK